jgi:hypothetical protein
MVAATAAAMAAGVMAAARNTDELARRAVCAFLCGRRLSPAACSFAM